MLLSTGRAYRVAGVPSTFFDMSSDTTVFANGAVIDIGIAPAVDRYVIVGIMALQTGAGSYAISAVNIGGVAATRLVQHVPQGYRAAEWWIANVPSGTTATVTVTTTGHNRWIIKAYSMVGLISGAAYDTDTVTALALDLPANGVAFLMSAVASINQMPAVWTMTNVWDHSNFLSAFSNGTVQAHAHFGYTTSVAGLALSSAAAGTTNALAVSLSTKGGALAPEQMADSDWSVVPTGVSGELLLTITGRPYSRGAVITDFKYQIDGGSWVSVGSPYSRDAISHYTALGNFTISGLTDGVEVDVSVCAVNEVGDGAPSVVKAVTPSADGVWEFLGGISTNTAGQTATVTVNNVPVGPDDADRYILLTIAYHSGGVSGSHHLASTTLGGVAGVLVGRSINANANRHVDQWKFALGGVSGATAQLVWQKGGSATNPWWDYTVASFYHVSDADGPTLLDHQAQVDNAGAASVTTTVAGDVVVGFVKAGWTGSPFLSSLSNIPTLFRGLSNNMNPSIVQVHESLIGHRHAMPGETIDVTAYNTSAQHMLATVWTSEQAAPTNLTIPVISGTLEVPNILSVTNGTWEAGHVPDSYTYQWKADGVDIGGATANTHTLTSSEANKVITCAVTATNLGGSTPVTTAATGMIIDSGFPRVETRSSGRPAAATTRAVTMPTGVTVGDVLLVEFMAMGSTTVSISSGTGWSILVQAVNNAVTTAILTKVADGSDALTIGTSTSVASSYMVQRISGSNGTVEQAGGGASNATASANPPNLVPAGGSQKYLWIAWGSTGSSRTFTVQADYSSLAQNTGATNGSMATSERRFIAASQDPGAFALSGSGSGVYARTIAVYPA